MVVKFGFDRLGFLGLVSFMSLEYPSLHVCFILLYPRLPAFQYRYPPQPSI